MDITFVVASGVARKWFPSALLLTGRLVVVHIDTEVVVLYYGDDSS